MVFVHMIKTFFGEPYQLVKLQIDNSLDLGWRRKDIILATNFKFEYKGIESIIVSDKNWIPYEKRTSKLSAMIELFERGFINKNELYWFHDLDTFQSEVITKAELEMGDADMALTDYCWRDKWNTGSIFFKSSAEDVFRTLFKTTNLFLCTDEEALMLLTNGVTEEHKNKWKWTSIPEVVEKIPKIKDINRRIKKLNTSYNFVPFYKIKHCYAVAIKPIKVVHFHPRGHFDEPNIPDLLRFYMYGENDINKVLMSDRLIKIFHEHGIK